MVKFKVFLMFILLIFLYCGCSAPQDTTPALPAEQQYDQMVHALWNEPMLQIEYKETTAMTYGSNHLIWNDEKQILLDTKKEDYYSSGTLCCGTHKIRYAEQYTDATLYLNIHESKFCGPQRPMQIPLPKPCMFSDHSVIREENTVILLFQDPLGSFWTLPEDAKVIAAEGRLIQSGHFPGILEYSIVYTSGQATFETAVTISYNTTSEQIPPPDADSFIPIANVLAPLKLEKSYGLLLQSTHLSSNCIKEIKNTLNTLDYSCHIAFSRQDASGTILTQTSLTDHSRGDGQITTTQKEAFQNGSYTIATNNQPAKNLAVGKMQFFNYFSQLLARNILAAKYVTNAEPDENNLIFTFAVNDQLAENICRDICQTLYNNPDFLDTQAENDTDHAVYYTIQIDPVTGLPLGYDLQFSCRQMIASIPYSLTAQYTQTIVYE